MTGHTAAHPSAEVTDDGTTDGVADPKSDTATVSIVVTEVNDAPTGVNDSLASSPEDTQVTIPFATLLANDSKGPANESSQNLTITAVGSAVGGSVSISGTNVIFTPTADYNGPASFTFKANDGALDSNVATVSITVTPVNDAPNVAVDIVNGTTAITVNEGNKAAIALYTKAGFRQHSNYETIYLR